MVICQGTRAGLPETELPDLLPGDLIVSGTRAGHAAWGGALEVLRLYPVAGAQRVWQGDRQRPGVAAGDGAAA